MIRVSYYTVVSLKFLTIKNIHFFLFIHISLHTDFQGEKGVKRFGVSIVIPQIRAFFMCFATT